MNIDKYIKALEAKMAEMENLVQVSVEMMDVLSNQNEELKNKVEELENLVAGAAGEKIKKNSRNSSLPPSVDINRPRRNQLLRKPTGRKSGGQKGHKGSTLEMSLFPDKVIPIIPKKCTKCGSALNTQQKVLIDSRQEIEIPPVKALTYQYDKYSIGCDCGHCNQGNMPTRLRTKVQYGPRMRSWMTYLMFIK